jgi:hypothetical protein
VVWLRQANDAAPDYPSILAPLAAALALAGHEQDARAMLARYLSLKLTKARTISAWRGNPARIAAFEDFAEYLRVGLRKAGMPEE